MLILEHRKRLVDACYPSSPEEATELWHDIRTVKFGQTIELVDPAPPSYELASYQIPEDGSYLVVLRTECYTFTFDPAAPGFGTFGPPPPGIAYWEYTDLSVSFLTEYRLTPRLQAQILLDSEEMLFAEGGNRLGLTAEFPANPDANERFVRTLVYAYLIGPKVADKIGAGEAIYFGT
jgi:hypothetical protein